MVDVPLKEAQGYMAEVTSRLGSLGQEYSWYASQYKDLKVEYDGAFMMMAPQRRSRDES